MYIYLVGHLGVTLLNVSLYPLYMYVPILVTGNRASKMAFDQQKEGYRAW